MINPFFIINFKCYKEATGKKALELAKKIDNIAEKSKADIAVVVQPTDIYLISENCKNLKIFAQHIDSVSEGSFTGSVTASAVRSSGASGILLNHSEKRLKLEDIELSIKLAKEKKLITIVCASDTIIAKAVSDLNPDYVAVEPEELISGKISISKAKPGLIAETLRKLQNSRNVKLLVGAGIHVQVALKLGASGILISSAIVKSRDPENLLTKMLISTL